MRIPIPFRKRAPRVSVIRMSGAIAAGGRGQRLNDEGLAPLVERAFAKGKPAAVALVINSPGGSPVQSSLIAARVRRLAEEKDIKVYAFVEDIAASGGYWLACAADEIWVDPTSIVGSIGVIYAGFGFQDLIAKHGVVRRVHTAGKSKSMLDPFRAEKPEDIDKLKSWQGQMHEVFIDHVRQSRGERLAAPDGEDMFTGDIWVGQKSVDVGLADGVGHVVPKMKEIFGDKVRFQVFGPKRGLLSRFGAQMASDAFGLVEERSLYARYGL
ncbi:Peptidase, family S49 [Candidatus Rhodobacter oscarellae]|uniref:Peptidase, family S49 n=1 Tax=Candidatus Rhodobacter oscarellae TaxID=1675527 RepID=A0A0J9E0K1_9RHOB|nr:S49 family peptidase [Candidatus Rhodobacter lobularis]KMW56250.1 Peptidase, family S49 [Candidatus Rhodobacter lobularis]